jgi:hypothetical protein
VHVGENLPSDSFDQLAMPRFERLNNFACWLKHDRQEAEDLVQETYAKRLRVLQQSRKRQRASCSSVRMGSSCGRVLDRLAVAHCEILLLCEVDVLSGNLCHSRYPDGHGDVALIQCQKSVRRWPAITVSKRMKQTVNYGL